MGKKKIIIIVSALLVCALVFAIYWKATENERYIKGEMKDIQEQVSEFRAGEKDSFHIYFLDYVAEDPGMEELLISLVKEMCENREGTMLLKFLEELEYTDYHSEALAVVLSENLGTSGDMDFVLGILDSYTFKSTLEYYNNKVSINRNSGAIALYIEEHGTQSFTTTPGEGYYADEEDGTTKEVIGIEGSNLHDSVSLTNYGDFQLRHSYGVRLNWSTYKEESYSFAGYYFRGDQLSFDPSCGECVWSGGYLFCFDVNGTLLGFDKLIANDPETLNQKYNNAVELMEAGNYEEAISAFEALHDYKDSADMIAACNASILENSYNAATALMEAGQHEEAFMAFMTLSGYRDSDEKAYICFENHRFAAIKTANIGDIVYFGFYEQDANPNSVEYMEWLVLDKQDDKLLVVSLNVIDCQPYNISKENVTWETCSLRHWLNNEFLNSTFSDVEKEMIPIATVSGGENPEYNNNAGSATQDQVFVLSISEAVKYFSSNDARHCGITEYAKAKGVFVNNQEQSTFWWLRSVGMNQDYAALGSPNGAISYMGAPVHTDDNGVRPALWIDLSFL